MEQRSSNSNNPKLEIDVTIHWRLGPIIFTYLQTCHWASIFEFWKKLNLFSLSTTVIRFFGSPSHENNDQKLIQTNAHPWEPHDLDGGNKKLSDITQNPSHPNKLYNTPWISINPNPLFSSKSFFPTHFQPKSSFSLFVCGLNPFFSSFYMHFMLKTQNSFFFFFFVKFWGFYLFFFF